MKGATVRTASNFALYKSPKLYRHAVFLALAAIAMLNPHPSFATDGISECRVRVFTSDPDPKGTNVRSGPGSKFSALAVITDNDSEIEVVGANGQWLRVKEVKGVDGTVYFSGDGWMYAPLTGVRPRRKTGLLANPVKPGQVIGNLEADEQLRVQSCKGQWIQVQKNNLKGWMEPGSYCGNPVTTCV